MSRRFPKKFLFYKVPVVPSQKSSTASQAFPKYVFFIFISLTTLLKASKKKTSNERNLLVAQQERKECKVTTSATKNQCEHDFHVQLSKGVARSVSVRTGKSQCIHLVLKVFCRAHSICAIELCKISNKIGKNEFVKTGQKKSVVRCKQFN